MIFPLKNYIFDLPEGDHVGSFLKNRKFHIHEGIDLYSKENDEVLSMDNGVIIDILNFTGKKVNSPWWNDTQAIVVKHEFGYILYGEVKVRKGLRKGSLLKKGEIIAFVKPVLKKRKNNPKNMLHLEFYQKYTGDPIELIKGKRNRKEDFYQEINKHGLENPLQILEKCNIPYKKSKRSVFIRKDNLVKDDFYQALLKKFEKVEFSTFLDPEKKYDIIINNKNYLNDKKKNNVIVEFNKTCADLIIFNGRLISNRRNENYEKRVYDKAASRIIEFFY